MIVILLAIVGYLTIISTKSLQRISQTILKENVTSLKAAEELELALLDQKGLVSNYLLDGDETWLELLEEKKQLFQAWFNKANEAAITERERGILKDILGLYVKYNELRAQVINFYRLGNLTAAKRLLFSEVRNCLDELYQGCENLLLVNEELIAGAQKKSERFVFKIRLVVWLAIGLAIALGLALGFLIFRTISKRILENERLASLGKLSAVVSHEIRNPLTAIKMRTQALKGEVQDIPWKEDLEVIDTEIVRLEKIVDDFVSLAKPLRLNLSLESITSIIENTTELIQPRIQTQGIELIKRLGNDTKVSVDKEKIKQALLNIFMNSLEAMPEGGKLEISTALNKDYLEINIRDTGIGISHKNRAKLFEPFFTTKKEGLGLGLSIVENIVKMHKGKIRIDSQKNRGTTLVITLPLKS